MPGKPIYRVMLSSTYKELVKHRDAIRQAMQTQELFPVAMENDAALPGHDEISASLAKVEEADGYVGLISYRYGQVLEDPDRNPNGLSLTELEFRRAVERNIPICMFIMHGEHDIPRHALDEEGNRHREKLNAFTALAKKGRIYAEFKSVDDLRAQALQSLVKLREAIEAETRSQPPLAAATIPTAHAVTTPGWEVVDRDAVARIRADSPALSDMVQFFDGILPTWRFALARGVQARAIAARLASRLSAIHSGANKPQVILLAGAGGEGKSTAVLQAAASLVENDQQDWTCLYRRAANAELPEDTLADLPSAPGHAWVVVIDDADNIAAAILAAVKRVAARTDIHLLLVARDAEWQAKKLLPGLWQPFADLRMEPLIGLDREDARRIVAGWIAWGDQAMGNLKGQSEDDAVAALLGHAREFAARNEAGELLGALLITRQGNDMRAHVRTLVNGLSHEPAIGSFSLRDVYAIVAAMHAENQLYLSRSVLAFALGCELDALEREVLLPLRREAMLDSGDSWVLTRHRRIAEAACAVMREDDDDVDRWYPFLARAALGHFHSNRSTPDIASWTFKLAKHFVDAGEARWPVAVSVAKAVWAEDSENVQSLTALASVLRRVGKGKEAMAALKATNERYRNHRGVLYEWSTTAGTIGDHGLDAWLCGRTLADGRPTLEPRDCKLSLSGLGTAFRKLHQATHDKSYAKGQAACGQLGLLLKNLDERAVAYFENHIADGRRSGIGDFSPEQAVEAIRKAVILGANEADPDNDPVFFERLIGEPDAYRYTTLLRMIDGAGRR
ncbi:MAG: DUF4062 domain-containing protein [Hyphomonadaceae bacterium]|nr:DUF4062 domain-containing protein [Hyphomonadaceae bacterium]